MDIKRFTQGEIDAQLFGLLGPWTTSSEVRREQGAPITSAPGDIWHICIDGMDVVGFALTKPERNGAHISNIYAERAPAKTRDLLLKSVLAMLRDAKVTRAYTVGRQDDALWERNGFSFAKGRGSFGTWERAL